MKLQSSPANPWKANRFSNASAAIFIVYIFFWNVRGLGFSTPAVSTYENVMASILRLDQYWNMFAPFPIKEDGWYVIPAQLRDGAKVDLFRDGQPLQWDKPALISAMFKNDRWRAYMMNLFFDKHNEIHLLQYAQYLCRQWNDDHPHEKQLITFDIVFMMKVIRIKGPSDPEKIVLWHHQCF